LAFPCPNKIDPFTIYERDRKTEWLSLSLRYKVFGAYSYLFSFMTEMEVHGFLTLMSADDEKDYDEIFFQSYEETKLDLFHNWPQKILSMPLTKKNLLFVVELKNRSTTTKALVKQQKNLSELNMNKTNEKFIIFIH